MRKGAWILLLGLSILSWVSYANTQIWKSTYLNNGLIDLQVVPEIGGRVLQYKLGDYGHFLVNEELYDKKPPASGVGPEDAWLNYGGDKLWLAPQGWDNDQQWPGPPDPVLDGQPYELEIISSKEIRLTSRKDPRSGVQLSRVIKIVNGTTRVSIDAAMKNIDTKPRRWGIWAHTQFNAGNRHGEGYNKNFWAYCPLNKNSIFPRKYDVQYGLVNNMSFQPDYNNEMMKVHYQRRVGKIGIDSPAGWVATVDKTDGYVFVQRFNYEPEKSYPDNSSVEIWMNGLGEFVAWGKINQMSEDPKENPYNFESEVISPYATLEPDQVYTYHYEWYTAKIPTGLGITDCTEAGVVCEPLTAKLKEKTLNVTGKFGVFYVGTINLSVVDENANPITVLASNIKVTPLESLDLNLNINDVEDISQSADVSMSLFDIDQKFIGEIAKVRITK